MKKQILIVLLASIVFSGCAAQSYSAAGSGVYVGSGSYSSSNLSIAAGYSSGPGWYGYPWYSAAYLHPVYPGYWPGYVSAGYGPGGFYGGFNWGWGYYNPSPYYRYPGYWGYNPYYGQGYRGHNRRGPYRHSSYRSHYAYAPYRPYYRGREHYTDEYYGGGHEYDRRGRGGNSHRPGKSVKQPVRIIRMPAHTSEAGYSTNNPGRRSRSVRSGSGNSGWKGNQPPPQQLHRVSVKKVSQAKPQAVKILHRQAKVVETGAGYTPPRSSSAQRSGSGRGHYKGSQPPPQQLHSGRKVNAGSQTQSVPAKVAVSYGQVQQRQLAPGEGAYPQQPSQQVHKPVQSAPERTERNQHKNKSANARSNKHKRANKHH